MEQGPPSPDKKSNKQKKACFPDSSYELFYSDLNLMNGAKVQYNFDLALISVYIKRRIILSLLIRLR